MEMDLFDRWRELNLALKTSSKDDNSGLVWMISDLEKTLRRLPNDHKSGDEAFNYCLSHFTTDHTGTICQDYVPRVRAFLGLVNEYQGSTVLYVKTAHNGSSQKKILGEIEGPAKFVDKELILPGTGVVIPHELFGPYAIRNHQKLYTDFQNGRPNHLVWLGYENHMYLTGILPDNCSRIWKRLKN
jgi:hypothetical protein